MTADPADGRAYYRALGVELPDRAAIELSVRCFANPEAHAHHDRRPSCSVNVTHGAWKCNGCGAKGGAYDAAIALGHSPRSAIDLMVAHGLTTRRARSAARRSTLARTEAPRAGAHLQPRRLPVPRTTPSPVGGGLRVTERDIDRWARALRDHAPALRYLAERRGWSPSTVVSLQVGLSAGRIAFPMRDASGALIGVQRYKPRRRLKALNVRGTVNGLFPHPARERARELLLVEGPPDALAARSRGLPAVALPGVQSWQPEWSLMFAGRSVVVVLDCDDEGRAAARRVADDLAGVALSVEVLDLDPTRADGFDLTDWLLAEPGETVPLAQLRASAVRIAAVAGAPATA